MNRAHAVIVAACVLSACEGRRDPALFVDRAQEWGIRAATYSGSVEKRHIRETLGQGACLLDYDNDGRMDLFLPNGPRDWREGKVTPAPDSWRLYRNAGGRFIDESQRANIATGEWGLGCAVGDVDGDGWDDLFVTVAGGRNRLLRNEGGKRFEDWSERSGLRATELPGSAAFGDLDGDGDLDLFVTTYVDEARPPEGGRCLWKGLDVTCGPKGFGMSTDHLYWNDGRGGFARQTDPGEPGYGLGVVLFDADDDNDLDVYVANDSSPKHLWINEGNGHFREGALAAGVALSESGTSQAGMGVDTGDLDGDGVAEIVVTNFADDINNVYHRAPDPIVRSSGAASSLHYMEWSYRTGMAAASYSLLGWAVLLEDFDLDGDIDIFTVNGHVYPQVDQSDAGSRYRQPLQLLTNEGTGRLKAVDAARTPALLLAIAGRGAATADLDADGDLDIVVTRDREPPLVLENRMPERGTHWLRVRLRGETSNRHALGARITLRAAGKQQTRDVRASRGYLSASDPAVTFGLGATATVDEIIVRWPDGHIDRRRGLPVDREITLERAPAGSQ